MEILGSILGLFPCLWDRTKTQVDYVRHLEENLRSLRTEKEKLMESRNDLLRKVEDAEERHMKCTERIVGWLERVDILLKEVDRILRHGEQQIQNTCLGGCHKNCWPTYKLGKEVSTKLKALSTLISEGNFNEDELAYLLPRPKVDQIPMDVPVGMDPLFERAWSFIQDDDVHIIGIYGMGGVGKSTLLAKINNMLAETSHEFDFVIPVVVSRDPNTGTIQDEIAKKLRFPVHTWSQNSQKEKAGEIFRVLSKKRFLLLLDDLWDPLFDLLQVGIPPLECNSKIIITTRSEDVCGGMGADKWIKVDCLTEQNAWELFKQKVGEEALYSHPQIEDLAKRVAKECGGLPIALITVGRAMASKKTLDEWSYTLRQLKEFAWKFPKMEVKVLHLLRYSYDSLGGEITKACFLSLSLFPEDYCFCRQHVIHNWMAEGFLKDGGSYMAATQEGHNIIRELKRACLLEAEFDECHNFRLHDVVRDMALRICSEGGQQNDKYLVRDYLDLTEPPPIPTWETAKLISLRGYRFEQLEGEPKCENLLTLNLAGKCLREIADDFFQYMPNLKVLDLSKNDKLGELPESLFKLTSLQILDLSHTGITELSPKFKKLQKLKFLNLSRTSKLELISPQFISSLSNLEKLELERSGLSDTSINELLDELESLKTLQHLELTVKSEMTLKKFSTSEKLYQITYWLHIGRCRGLSSLQLKNNNVLQRLTIYGCEDMKKVTVCWTRNDILRKVCFRDLEVVLISKCKLLKDATWLMALPNLRELEIRSCHSMKDVIGVGGGGASMVPGNINAFASLEVLFLRDLPALKRICSHALPFPRLTTLFVEQGCPELKKLPFDSNYDARKLKIGGEREWWDGLEWEDEAVRATLNPCLRLY